MFIYPLENKLFAANQKIVIKQNVNGTETIVEEKNR